MKTAARQSKPVKITHSKIGVRNPVHFVAVGIIDLVREAIGERVPRYPVRSARPQKPHTPYAGVSCVA